MMFLTLKVHRKEKDEIDEVSELIIIKNMQKSSMCITQVHENSKRKYPNSISNFTFQISLTASTIFQGDDQPLT